MNEEQSRRLFLRSGSAAAVFGALGAAAAPVEPTVAIVEMKSDPIFAVIKDHAAAASELEIADSWLMSIESPSDADDCAYDVVYNRDADCHRRLFATKATTIAGVEAFASHVLKYPRIATFDGGEFSLTKAISMIAESLRDILAI